MAGSSSTVGKIRIGTRNSRLARWQSEWVADRLCVYHPDLVVELVEIKTQGDRDRNSPLAAIGGVGLFTKEIQRALADGSVDLAVHSLKDLPTQGPADLILGAVPAREDVADALIAPVYQTIEALPQGARVGTSSPRRRAQMLSLRPDLDIVTIRGNVETRLAQALDGRLDAVILACAGLRRLGLEAHVTQRLAPPEFLPAVGQGALGIECRRDAPAVLALLARLDDPVTHRAIRAERAALAVLEGGCTLPMAAWARDIDFGTSQADNSRGPAMAIDAIVFDPDGRAAVFVSLTGPRDDPDALGYQAAQALLDEGATPLLGRNPSSDQGPLD